MTDLAAHIAADLPRRSDHSRKPQLDSQMPHGNRWLFAATLLGGLAYAGISILLDTGEVGKQLAVGVFLFLGFALGFEFVNGFHDTANTVATVIYTHAMPAPVAVLCSGVFNFPGVCCRRAR